jgi:lipid-binding SYLF domain-containing protein
MKTFKTIKITLFATMAAFICFSSQAWAGDTMTNRNEAEKIVRDATRILNKATDSKTEQNVSASKLENAVGIAVFPDRIGKESVAGNEYSPGVLLVRQKNDEWGLPLFVNISSGGPKDQFGAESSNLVLTFQHKKVLNDLKKGRDADIFSYGGVSSIFPSPGSVSGKNSMMIAKDLMAAYYNQPGKKEGLQGHYKNDEEYNHMVETGTMKEIPKSAEQLQYALNSYTSSIK